MSLSLQLQLQVVVRGRRARGGRVGVVAAGRVAPASSLRHVGDKVGPEARWPGGGAGRETLVPPHVVHLGEIEEGVAVALAEQERRGRAGVTAMVVVGIEGVLGQHGGDVDVEVDEIAVDGAPGHELLQPGVPLQLQRADALDAVLVVRRPGHGGLLISLAAAGRAGGGRGPVVVCSAVAVLGGGGGGEVAADLLVEVAVFILRCCRQGDVGLAVDEHDAEEEGGEQPHGRRGGEEGQAMEAVEQSHQEQGPQGRPAVASPARGGGGGHDSIHCS